MCSRGYIKAHYQRNKTYYVKKASKRNTEIRNKVLDYLGSYLSTHPCIDCGETDLLVLELDHKDRQVKDDSISQMIRRSVSFEVFVRELKKCDVRCANCHRRKTEKENNSWRLHYAPVA